jgi:hypothetical protein
MLRVPRISPQHRIPSLLGGGLKPWDFNPNLVSFTPGMAKRATSVFAAAPIVQGKRDGTGTPDVLTFPQGAAPIAGWFYPNLDTYQGSIVFRITPEWNGNDGIEHIFMDWRTGSIIEKDAANHLIFCYQDYGSIAGWVAGTTYNICLRWDNKNTLDGTNYSCISVNDIHVFGMTVQPMSYNAWPDIYIGQGAVSPANAIIEGLTVYRRVLYDGTYGVDVGNGDEVNLITAP